jgi:hypothetical protein
MECVIETKAGTVLEFIRGLRRSICVTFEEGTSATWLYDLLKPHIAQVEDKLQPAKRLRAPRSQDCSDRLKDLEKRRTFRSRTIETTSSLSV